ncbi:MAG: YbhB/YbcL family Raf kinase inhibitor-like protein [Desulfobacteraceae bacterium]|nr:YbhB/YbcL family Raf kinase inhibitor-like protein [Desulfobacteraceae bacterium]
MKRIAFLVAMAVALGSGSAVAAGFTVKSDELGGQLTADQVYSGFGCTGRNISPSLAWADPPAQTKSFAVTVYDPDAPTGTGWWHWLVFNIPAGVHRLPANAGNPQAKLLPAGSVQSVTSYGKPGYGGACPPVGDKPHRYVFTVYALDTEKLDLGPDATPALVGFQLNQHALAKASLISYYGR